MEDITTNELKERLANGEKPFIVDVREPHEYEEFNIGALNIPLGSLPQRLDELESHKDEEIILHCRSGARSGNAKAYLLQQGFPKVRNLLGGMLAWQAQG
ncbi:rhodanese-like domain-containing protein [Adhaeribacter swui]|uniref:Rhodanese-like domain-containing protein n=1 Tax=Adhaeribacter swui TaxID=2086471 RepID=A0A7G7GEA1_9BACT|nr:rhodanese-like domain-containing protein [Adhaeribacter swui]QNF35485.1 rhodanese-like domain-containing protein [Adhaeribacter swui]